MNLLTNAEWRRSQFDGLGFCDSYNIKVRGTGSETHWMHVSLTTMCEVQSVMIGEGSVPQWVNNSRVMAFMRVPARVGEYQSQGIVILDREQGVPPANRYVVLSIGFDGERWTGWNGLYDLTQAEALTEFSRRIARDCNRPWVPNN